MNSWSTPVLLHNSFGYCAYPSATVASNGHVYLFVKAVIQTNVPIYMWDMGVDGMTPQPGSPHALNFYYSSGPPVDPANTEGIDSERGLEMALRRQPVAARVPAARRVRSVPDHSWLSRTRSPPAAGNARQGFHLGAQAACRAWLDQRRADRRGCLDDGGQRGAAHARAARQRRGLSRDADAHGEGERHRDADDRGPGPARPQTQGQDAVERGLDSPTDPDAKIAKLKDGRTHLAYKPEHAMDLDTGSVVGAEVHAADQGDTTTMPGTLASAARHLAAVEAAPTPEAPAELIADKGYHSRATLKELDEDPGSRAFPSCIAINSRVGTATMRCGGRSITIEPGSYPGVARAAFKLRAERVERGFALILDRGGMRRAWLRGREKVQKRYRIHVAG